jgi:hypothetical protein
MSTVTAILLAVSAVLAAALILMLVATGNTEVLEWVAATSLTLSLLVGLTRLQLKIPTSQPKE